MKGVPGCANTARRLCERLGRSVHTRDHASSRALNVNGHRGLPPWPRQILLGPSVTLGGWASSSGAPTLSGVGIPQAGERPEAGGAGEPDERSEADQQDEASGAPAPSRPTPGRTTPGRTTPSRSVPSPPEARLARMKLTAAGFLTIAAAIFVGSTLGLEPSTLRGYLLAGSEAAMVGGLADWFAVTALFRRPLGLPIPHTALVPRKKDELATKLGEFVTGYFLTPDVLESQVVESRVVDRVGLWLADPDHAARLAGGVMSALADVLGSFDPAGLEEPILDLVRRHRGPRSWAPALGGLLARAVDGGAQRPLVDLLAARCREYLAAHEASLHPMVKRFVEERNWLTALMTTDRLVTKLLRDVQLELAKIEQQPDHPVRVALEDLLRRLAFDLRHDPDAVARVDGLLAKLVDDPQATAVVRSALGDALDGLRRSMVDPGGPLAARVAAAVAEQGRRAVTDVRFHDELEGGLRRVVAWVVGRYGGEVTELIRRQVEAWPAEAASRRIELAVGRDLQYIRLNGTVVGAIAGLVIHAAGSLLARA